MPVRFSSETTRAKVRVITLRARITRCRRNGYARAFSGVSVESFTKTITFQKLTREGIQNLGPAIETMARR